MPDGTIIAEYIYMKHVYHKFRWGVTNMIRWKTAKDVTMIINVNNGGEASYISHAIC